MEVGKNRELRVGGKGERPDAAVMVELRKISEQITRNAAELLKDRAKAEELLK